MIANTLIFLLGVLVTTLAAMVLAPVFWRKAQSLARREFEATIPISANEIRAEFDRVRAEAAVSVRRQEVLTMETREAAAKSEADRGRVVVEATQLQKRCRQLTQTVEELDLELTATRGALAEREREIGDLVGEVSELRHAAGLAEQEAGVVRQRLREIDDARDTLAIELTAAHSKIERLESRLGPSDQQESDAETRVEKLATEIADLQQALRREKSASSLREDKLSALTLQLAKSDAETDRLTRAASATHPSKPIDSQATSIEGQSGGAAMANEPHRKGSSRFDAAVGRRELAALAPEAEADIRERISDLAARVIRMTALAEGPASPLVTLLEPAPFGEAAAPTNAVPTLADRVRALAEAERGRSS